MYLSCNSVSAKFIISWANRIISLVCFWGLVEVFIIGVPNTNKTKGTIIIADDKLFHLSVIPQFCARMLCYAWCEQSIVILAHPNITKLISFKLIEKKFGLKCQAFDARSSIVCVVSDHQNRTTLYDFRVRGIMIGWRPYFISFSLK